MNLRRFLYPNILRKKVSEKTGKVKSPVSMMSSFPEELDLFLTSKTDGTFEFVSPEDNEKVMSNFFEVEEDEQEDDYFRPIIEAIFEYGSSKGWGNLAVTDEITEGLINSIGDFFQSYELPSKWVFCSSDVYQLMAENSLISHPSEDDIDAPPLPSRGAVQEFQKEHLHLGSLKSTNTPVLLEEGLGPYIVASAPDNFVGMLTRSSKFMSIVLHNVERGVVIIKLQDYEYEFSSENNEGSPTEHPDGTSDGVPEEEGRDPGASE